MSDTDVLGLRDQPVLVVGGGSGIGRATANLLARVGARVAVGDVDPDRAAEVAKEVDGQAVVGDVLQEDGATALVDAARDALGGLRGLINIIGLASWTDLMGLDQETWERDLRMN